MQKLIILALLIIAITATIISDIKQKLKKGIPDIQKTGIHTNYYNGQPKLGFSSVKITDNIIYSKKKFNTPYKLSAYIDSFFIDQPNINNFSAKKITDLYVKTVILKNDRILGIIITIDIFSISKPQKDLIISAIKNKFDINEKYIQIYTTLNQHNIHINKDILEQKIIKCINTSLNNLHKAKYSYIRPNIKNLPPANINRIKIKGIGGFDIPPLSGPMINNSVYDATKSVNGYLSNITRNHNFFNNENFKTKEFNKNGLSCLIFKTDKGVYLGGIIFSAYQPIISPKNDISSDYIYHLCSFLEKKTGGLFLFLKKPGEEIVPYIDNFSHPNAYRFGTKAGSALTVMLKSAKWKDISKIRVYCEKISIPKKKIFSSNIELIKKMAQKYKDQANSLPFINIDLNTKMQILDNFLSFAFMYETKISEKNIYSNEKIKGILINDFLITSLPGRLFFSTGQKIKNHFNKSNIEIVNRLDYYNSFIVPKDNFTGGYRPNISIYSKKAEDLIVKEAVSFINSIKNE